MTLRLRSHSRDNISPYSCVSSVSVAVECVINLTAGHCVTATRHAVPLNVDGRPIVLLHMSPHINIPLLHSTSAHQQHMSNHKTTEIVNNIKSCWTIGSHYSSYVANANET